MSSSASARLFISPKGGQIAISLLIVCAALFFGVSVWLMSEDKSYYLSLAGSLVFLVVGALFWWVSHKNEALREAHPFKVSVANADNSIAVSADVRALPAVDYLKLIISQCSEVLHRDPLPNANGIVGADGMPVPQSERQAQQATADLNEQAKKAAEAFARQVIDKIPPSVLGESPVINEDGGADCIGHPLRN